MQQALVAFTRPLAGLGNLMVAAGEEDQRALPQAPRRPAQRQHPPDEDQMVAAVVHGVALALEMRQGAGDERHAGQAGDRLEAQPLAGAGLVSIRQIFPYTLGSNIGTTVTAILAALATQNDVAVTVAFAHLCFNVFGILLLYPFRFIPIWLAEFVGVKASKSKKNLALFVIIYILLHFIPVIMILF